MKSSATTPVETMSFHDSSITTFLGLQLLLLFFCFLSSASFSDAIPSTLDGPFTPVTITLDTSLRGKAVDLPDSDPRVQRYVTGFQPEQISLALSSNYDSIWVSWITGSFSFYYQLFYFFQLLVYKVRSCGSVEQKIRFFYYKFLFH